MGHLAIWTGDRGRRRGRAYKPAATLLLMSGVVISAHDFAVFASPLKGLPVSHVWNGYGSAIFLEFGALTPSARRRRDGSLGTPTGEFTLMIEWSWRIEGKRRIWCGSWSDRERWARIMPRLKDASVAAVSLTGRLPEIDLAFSNGIHLVSCMTAEGDPEWGLISRRGDEKISVDVRAGRLVRTTELPHSD